MGSNSVVQCVRHLMGQPLYCSTADAGRVGRGGMVIAPPPTHDLAVSVCFHGCLAFFHWHFPSRFPSSPPLNQSLCNQQQPLLWDFSTIPKLQFPGAEPSRGPVFLSGVCMAASRTVWFSFYLGCHRTSVSLSALNVSPWLRKCPSVGIGPLLQFSHPPRAGPVLPTLLFFPLVPSYSRVLHGSIYPFPLVRYSCPLSADALLCLKVYPWCICGERCTPHPPTPPPSCSLII